ncbi:hypothetical protein DPMN_145488 [Dreissena polymorpha]|uniref:Uncharacterized protein n=1 Tax=Dreissena polymorpha TaxID=45954 RepID=A0A9D4F646_DREPO|nr:hypothetical protein DPMN_145488 [Dreissena polymorpha]
MVTRNSGVSRQICGFQVDERSIIILANTIQVDGYNAGGRLPGGYAVVVARQTGGYQKDSYWTGLWLPSRLAVRCNKVVNGHMHHRGCHQGRRAFTVLVGGFPPGWTFPDRLVVAILGDDYQTDGWLQSWWELTKQVVSYQA